MNLGHNPERRERVNSILLSAGSFKYRDLDHLTDEQIDKHLRSIDHVRADLSHLDRVRHQQSSTKSGRK